MSSNSNFNEFDVDNLVFYGKRSLRKEDFEEAQKCMDELKQMLMNAELTNSPRIFHPSYTMPPRVKSPAFSFMT